LAKKYGRPLAIFFFPEPPYEEEIEKSFRTVPENQINDLSPSMRKILRKAQVMQINLKELNNEINPSKKQIISDLKINENTSPVKFAEQVRSYFNISLEEQKKWKTTEDALKNWRDIFEDNGLFVFKDAFRQENKEISGFCLYDEQFPIIYINNSIPKTRQIFTLFHELFHLLLKINDICLENNSYLNQQIEIKCNKFAGEFLVPTKDLIGNLDDKTITEEKISSFSNLYKVSREVILRKFLDLKKINEQSYKKLVEKWKKDSENKTKGSGGDYYNTKIIYLGMNYLDLVFQRYNQNIITVEQAADYLNTKVKSFSSLEEKFLRRFFT